MEYSLRVRQELSRLLSQMALNAALPNPLAGSTVWAPCELTCPRPPSVARRRVWAVVPPLQMFCRDWGFRFRRPCALKNSAAMTTTLVTPPEEHYEWNTGKPIPRQEQAPNAETGSRPPRGLVLKCMTPWCKKYSKKLKTYNRCDEHKSNKYIKHCYT